MFRLLADNDVRGHLEVLSRHLEGNEWCELWHSLGTRITTFEELGLKPNTPDAELWKTCQAEQLILITGNRKDEGPESLEGALRASGSGSSLPVVTIGEPARVLRSRTYAERAAVRLMEILLD